VSQLVEKSVLGVNNRQLLAAMPEGDEASVEPNAADRVVMRTKAREASCTLLNIEYHMVKLVGQI